MTKIDALRNAMRCEALNPDAREVITGIVEEYEERVYNSARAWRSRNSRKKILRLMDVGEVLSAEQISALSAFTNGLGYRWREFSPNMVAGLLRKAIQDGDVVIDHKETHTITICPYNEENFEKEVSFNLYRRVK